MKMINKDMFDRFLEKQCIDSSSFEELIHDCSKNLCKNFSVFHKEPEWEDENFTFNSKSRERIVRNILCDMKSYIIQNQDDFEVTFEKLGDSTDGCFKYLFKVLPIESDDSFSDDKVEKFCKLREYLLRNFEYIFNGDVNVTARSYKPSLSLTFEIFSRI